MNEYDAAKTKLIYAKYKANDLILFADDLMIYA